jgi:hypothetical protein
MGIAYDTYKPYLEVCREAINNPVVFDSFRNNSIYTGIVSEPSYNVGLACVSEIKKEFIHDPKLLNKFSQSDSVGHPALYFYNELERVMSSATMRYIRILIELKNTFGSLDDIDIIEIGSGYGGQCKIIYDLFTPKSYTLVDLPEALEVARKYLHYFRIPVIYRAINDLNYSSYNLCISNFAYSEIEREEQQFYEKDIIRFSHAGYMICNGHVTKEFMMSLKKNGSISSEIPETCVDNFVYTWK